MTDLVAQLRAGHPRALPRLLTLVENGDPAGLAALERLYPETGRAHVVGVTGPPGAGKSTLVNALVGAVRASGRTVAVVAVDPTSPLSGGAVLGDRIRMNERAGDQGVFIRSMASRRNLGGLANATARAVHLLDAAGYPVILVETVGAGQDGVDVAGLAQTVVVVQVPGLGDGVQAIKAGILEIGDVLVVNKADLPGAAELARLLRDLGARSSLPEAWRTPVLQTSATTGVGIAALLEAIDSHRSWLAGGGRGYERLRAGAQSEVLGGLRLELERRLAAGRAPSPPLSSAIAAVARRDRTAESVIAELADRLIARET